MNLPPEPGTGDRILVWAREVQRVLREFDRRLNTILPARPRRRSDPPPSVEPQPLELSIVWVDDEPKVRVHASTIAGGSSEDLGFATGDSPPYLLEAEAGVVQGGITINEDGDVTSRWIEIVPMLTPDTDDTFHVEIGTVAQVGDGWAASNSRYGPITTVLCRRWFTTEGRLYDIIWR